MPPRRLQNATPVFAEMARRADAAYHLTVWVSAEGRFDDGTPTKLFLFATLAEDAAKRVEEVLDREKLLCQTDLGVIEFNDIERLHEREATMRQKITQKHDADDDGNPAGGTTTGDGIYIQWQSGPLKTTAPDGAFVEGVILAAIGRLQFYQTANGKKFACRENALAITKLEEALMWCEERTRGREERKVEGTNTP